MILLLEGKANAYVHPGLGNRRWDTAAAEAIIRAARGELTDIRGHRYTYTKNDSAYPINSINLYGILATAPSFERAKLIKHIKPILNELINMYNP